MQEIKTMSEIRVSLLYFFGVLFLGISLKHIELHSFWFSLHGCLCLGAWMSGLKELRSKLEKEGGPKQNFERGE